MKKLFTLLALAAGVLTASAEGFALYHGDTPLADGAVVEVGYDKPAPVLTVWEAGIYLQAPERGDYRFTATTEGSGVQVCLPPSCQPVVAGTPLVLVGTLEGEEKHDLQIHRQVTGASTPTEEVVLKLSVQEIIIDDDNAPIGDPVNITVKFVPKTSEEVNSIDAVTVQANTIGLAAPRVLRYSVGQSATRLSIYSLTGAQAMSATISGTGTLSLDRLAPGIYIYRAGSLTGKLLVK